MVTFVCAIVGSDSTILGGLFTVDIDKDKLVGHLKESIRRKKIFQFPADKLQLFLAKKENGLWLADYTGVVKNGEDLLIKSLIAEDKTLRDENSLEEVLEEQDLPLHNVIHILVVLPDRGSALLHQVSYIASYMYKYCDGGVNPEDPRTLFRNTLTTEIINRLEETRVLLVPSPRMTGRTSIALLVCEALVNEQSMNNQKKIVFNFSAFTPDEFNTFEEKFYWACGVDWEHAAMTLPLQDCVVYFVLDDAQMLYGDPPRYDSTTFWTFVKSVLNNPSSNIRILMFSQHATEMPIKLDKSLVLRSRKLNFTHDEVCEYVSKWFKGFSCFEGALPRLEVLYASLELLTGGHVGLTARTVKALNEVANSCHRRSSCLPSPTEWIHMMYDGSLHPTLRLTSAVVVLSSLDSGEMERLERMVYGENDTDLLEKCFREGILVPIDQGFHFSSPVLGNYFFELRASTTR
ncbi:hypothetical protein P3T76_009098 [Phytophthora citrophthora]|uniref:Crinkler effector protein N-terminal domain-containing protein n=1 Tax=Phytophthora citrophthora TaxID=4793 RepID=A0AAD9LJF9_9STRA|nr:hypothetical protein P3T76_009098 [Phytophthora citrophthora]